MIYDDEEPYGGPDNYDQHMRENERFIFSRNALARMHQMARVMAVIETNPTLSHMVHRGLQVNLGMGLNDLGHFQHLLSECNVDEKDIQHFLAKKEAA
jgi:hypothetical protein